MIAAFDVHYRGDGYASAAAVCFHDYRAAASEDDYVVLMDVVSPYIPGQFYKRELPCILKLLDQFRQPPDEMIVDGYVMLGHRPGLGRYLFESFCEKIPVIGVAKSKYPGTSGLEVLRGRSRRPLYITSAGLDVRAASQRILSMHGPYRVPTLLKRVDALARGKADTVLPSRHKRVG